MRLFSFILRESFPLVNTKNEITLIFCNLIETLSVVTNFTLFSVLSPVNNNGKANDLHQTNKTAIYPFKPCLSHKIHCNIYCKVNNKYPEYYTGNFLHFFMRKNVGCDCRTIHQNYLYENTEHGKYSCLLITPHTSAPD